MVILRNHIYEQKYNNIRIIMSIIGTVYEDVTTDVLGDIGSWQWLVTVVSAIFMFSSFFQHYEDTFLLQPGKVMCIPEESHENIVNETLCSYALSNGTEIPCVKWHLKLMWVLWIEKSWILFCDNKMKLLLTAVIFRLATIFGFVIFGLVADSFGRKNALIINVFAVLVLKTAAAFCNSEAWFRLVLFLDALFGTATMFIGLIIVSEIASNGWRSRLNVVVLIPRLLALVSKVHIANGASNPETYNLIGCIFGIVFVFLLKWVPESPQWMLYNRQIHVAENLLTKAAKRNNIVFSAQFKIRPVNQRAYLCLDETMACFRILSVRCVRIIVAVTLVFWGVFHFIWGFLFLKVFSEGVGEIMLLKVFGGLVGMGLLTSVMSRILTLQRFLIINLVFYACVTAGTIVLKHKTVHEILSPMALASGLIIHALLLDMTPRFYAINIRATLFGCCHATGQLGAMISYIIFIYEAMDDIIFVALELSLSLFLVVLSFTLPHVDGRELPDVLEDMDLFSVLSKPLRWATQKRSSASNEEVQMRIHSFSAPSPSINPSLSRVVPIKQHEKDMTPWHRLVAYFQRKKHRQTATRSVNRSVRDSHGIGDSTVSASAYTTSQATTFTGSGTGATRPRF